MEKKSKNRRLGVVKLQFFRVIPLFLGHFVILLFFESAKKIRTVAFYNKELKQRLLIFEINTKKLKYRIAWRIFVNTKCEVRKIVAADAHKKQKRYCLEFVKED